jgi:hypothetical protein
METAGTGTEGARIMVIGSGKPAPVLLPPDKSRHKDGRAALLLLTSLLAAGTPYDMQDFKAFSGHKYYRDKPALMPKKEQGRNERCNCGSGKKYKYCCGKATEGVVHE